MENLGLRERKKRETFARIVHEARMLVDREGLDGATVDKIAAAAEISPRTFFNYFSCKEDAVIGSDPQLSSDAADELRRRPLEEGAVEALRNLLLGGGDGHMLNRWVLRNELVRRHPELLPRHLTAFERTSSEFAKAIADRLGIDAAVDPRPAVIVGAVLGAMRTTITWWQYSDRSTDLYALLGDTLSLLEPLDSESDLV